MADKINDDNLDNPIISNSETPVGETIPNQKPVNEIQETENMEVHQHSHAHGNKNWKAYAWEFLMLFLAVFCGFLAEYQLEHKIERNREKQYIESMVQDLSEDTAKMNSEIARNTKKFAGIDSLLNNIYATPYTDSSLKIMYRLNDYLYSGRAQVYFTKRTITQLKNSGGLRLIRNKAASDSIVVYDENCEKIEKQFDVMFMHQLKARDVEYKILDPRCKLQTNTKFTLLNKDDKLMMEYASWLTTAERATKYYVVILKDHKERAIRIMGFLQKEYFLD